MHFHRIIFILFFSFLLIGSCTIHKRVHSRGYHIEWKKRYRESHSRREKKELEKVEDTLAVETTEEADTLIVSSDTLIDPMLSEPIIDSIAEKPEKDSTDRKFEKVGVLSAGMLFPAFLVALADDETNTGDYRRDFWLSVALLAILALMFVLGIVSMVRYLHNPKAYKFNIWAIIGLLIPLAVLIGVLSGAMMIF
jgi:hypothetical protein